jgi:hypothetical protein
MSDRRIARDRFMGLVDAEIERRRAAAFAAAGGDPLARKIHHVG